MTYHNVYSRLEVVLKEKKEERSKYYNKWWETDNTVRKIEEELKLEKQSNKHLKELIQNNEKSVSEAKKTQDENKKLKAEVDRLTNKLDEQWSTNMQNVDLKRAIKNKTDEITTLKKEITTLETQNGDMRANINRQERFIDAMKKCSRTNDMPRMAKLAYLMANEKYDDLDEELDECLKRIRTARMVQ